MDEQNLQQFVESEIGRKTIFKIEIPEFITNNLKHDFWYWQKEALQYFIAFDDPEYEFEKYPNEPTHLMFNMATGTGKTLLMAALIMYYYNKGYNHFIFFVNQNNIVDKTENNFINKSHTKYLFKQNIVINDTTINIRKVETFDDINDIQIKFTSIHKLHNAVYLAKENSVTLEDLQKRNLVMIGDEAHHLNASTIRNGQLEMDLSTELKESASSRDVEKSWEITVLNKILRREKTKQELENKNVLLEFTATIPRNKEVIEKYRTKTIYTFELLSFLKAGYTKEINLVSTSLKKKEKILLALLFNWYRHHIALKYKVPNFKPVILFRSKFIEESKEDYKEFLSLIVELKLKDFNFIKDIDKNIKEYDSSSSKVYEQSISRIKQILDFIKEENVKIRDIVNFIKSEFAEKNCIITNSEDNKAITKEKTTEEQNKLLNSLEDKNNHIRAIFTVKRLTEGWDVLNLFDIVRLYVGRDETRQNNQRVAGQATVQEIQLIGRGVRYYPFNYGDFEKSKRKFDSSIEKPIRILEEFYYHSDDDHRYLDELKRELKNKGFIEDNRIVKKFGLKDEFKESDFFKTIKIWKNEKIDNPKKKKKTLKELEDDFLLEQEVKDVSLTEQHIVLDEDKDKILAESIQKEKKTIRVRLKDFGKNIILKAINIKAMKDLSLLRFNNLRNELKLSSIDEIIHDKFLGNFRLDILVSEKIKSFEDISNEQKLKLLLKFFDEFIKRLKEILNPYIGTKDFESFSFKELFDEDKEKNVLIDQDSVTLEKELLKHSWYVLNGFNGTSEERDLIDFLINKIGNLKEKYYEIYLLRNEEVYKIYDFDKGRGFEPDFLLFLKGKEGNLYYQVFIESKGSQFKDKEGGFKESKEGWKEEFLLQLSNKYTNGSLLKAENNNYKLIGLPLFNKKEELNFSKVFTTQLLD